MTDIFKFEGFCRGCGAELEKESDQMECLCSVDICTDCGRAVTDPEGNIVDVCEACDENLEDGSLTWDELRAMHAQYLKNKAKYEAKVANEE